MSDALRDDQVEDLTLADGEADGIAGGYTSKKKKASFGKADHDKTMPVRDGHKTKSKGASSGFGGGSSSSGKTTKSSKRYATGGGGG